MSMAAAVLVDPARALEALRGAGLDLASLELTYRRVQEDGGVAAYRLRGHGPDGEAVDTIGYARWTAPERIAEMLAKWRDRAEPGPFGEGVRAIPGLPALLFLLPNDRGLRLLHKVADLARLKRVLAPLPELEPAGWRVRERKSALEFRRYKPEQRLVAWATLGLAHDRDGETRTLEAIVRLFADDRGAALARDIEAWREGGAAPVLPRPLGALEHGHLYVEEAVPGETLRAAVRAGRADAAGVAAALATLHGARVSFPRERPAEARLATAHAVLHTLRLADVVDDAGVAALAGPLTAALPARVEPRPVHGDLHARQMLAGANGIVIVDLERCAMGDPLDDWGSLLAHLKWESRALLPEGAAAGPFAEALRPRALASAPGRPERDLAFFVAVALVEVAELPVRRRAPGAAETARLALQLARDTLG